MDLDERSDSEALAASIDDSEAFLVILDRHVDRIAGYVARRVGAAQTEELISEVFVRAFEHRARYDAAKADALPWLYGITTNVLREHFRDSQRELSLIDRVRGEAVVHGAVGSKDEFDPVSVLTVKALLELPTKDREPLVLYALGDLDYQQIADALDIPLGTVRSRINRARGLLRRQLAEAVTPRSLSKEGVVNG